LGKKKSKSKEGGKEINIRGQHSKILELLYSVFSGNTNPLAMYRCIEYLLTSFSGLVELKQRSLITPGEKVILLDVRLLP
jgi:hypothetical protein